MNFFRSGTILHLKIRMPSDIEGCLRIMDSFGKINIDSIQFIDLNKEMPESKKKFNLLIKRCKKIEEKIDDCFKYARNFNIKLNLYKKYDKFINDLEMDIGKQEITLSGYFDLMEQEVFEIERHTCDLIDSYEKIKEDLIIELEKKMVFEQYFSMTGGLFSNLKLKEQTGIKTNSLECFMGTVNSTEELKMHRMILRVSRGRAVATFFDFNYPPDINFDFIKNSKSVKRIFVVFFPNEIKDYILKKLLQICDIISASHYNLPENKTKQEVLLSINLAINDKKEYLIESEGSIKKSIRQFTGTEENPSRLDFLRLYAKKEIIIYSNLNKCNIRDNFIDGEVWVLEKKKDLLISLLNSGVSKDQVSSVGEFIEIYNDKITKPTYIKVNDFTSAFQEIVNIYGIPRYKEINPAYFCIVIFPFCFGVMFGDSGHGLIILLFSLYLFYYNKRINERPGDSPLKLLSKYRYFILLLGLSSIYCGILYNEFLSVPLYFTDTCYQKISEDKLETIKKENCNYGFGLDPKWFISSNELSFTNSMKMKLSVIIGVFHMFIGIFIKGFNDLYFKNYLNFIFEFIPQVLFLGLLMGYMDILIFVKWSTIFKDTSLAPSIVSTLINIVLKKGSVNNKPLWGSKAEGDEKYTQEKFQGFILAVLIILIPIMLIPKPLLEYKKFLNRKRLRLEEEKENNIYNENNDDNQQQTTDVHDTQIKQEEEDYNKTFIDFLINQIISSVEFILGTVSNTASYLRLWALSLAHAQLSKVFFEKTLRNMLKDGDFYFGLGYVSLFVGYFIFANITIFVLIGMDLMECFLHTLRLQWVEFQNKFYYGDGYLFEPYSFRAIFNSKERPDIQ